MTKPDDFVTEVLSRPFCPMLLAEDFDTIGFEGYGGFRRDSWAGQSLPTVLQATDMQVRRAVEIGNSGFLSGSWSALSKHVRREVLLAWADEISRKSGQLALINCLETGRSIRSLVDDSLPKAIKTLRWFAELADKLEDRSVHTGEFGADFALVRKGPLGLVAVILPWNDPLVTLVWKIAPALIMGNAVIVKPSEFATLVIREVIYLGHRAGIPKDHLQMLSGNGLVGERIVIAPGVAKIAFTGSTSTAIKIATSANSAGLKRLSFECGGKGAFIFGEKGANVDAFANVVAKNMFYNQGQICSAPSVVHVPKKFKTEIVSAIATAAKKFEPQHPFSGGAVGLMISRDVVTKWQRSLEQIETNFFVDGTRNLRLTEPLLSDWALRPTILVDLPEEHDFWDREIFAPILLIRSYTDLSEAIWHANKSKYGLACGVWSQDIDECMSIVTRLRAGNCHINSWGDDPDLVPFGGTKESGYGREKSIETLSDYSYTKSIYYRPAGYS